MLEITNLHAEIDAASAEIFHAAADTSPEEQVHVATFTASATSFGPRGHGPELDADRGRILRSVVMKPESEPAIPSIHRTLEALAAKR